MNKQRILKLIGLIGSITVGGSLIANGQLQEGIGVIAAALSSTSAVITK